MTYAPGMIRWERSDTGRGRNVAFVGRKIASHQTDGLDAYITRRGRIAVHDDDEALYEYDTVEALEADGRWHTTDVGRKVVEIVKAEFDRCSTLELDI